MTPSLLNIITNVFSSDKDIAIQLIFSNENISCIAISLVMTGNEEHEISAFAEVRYVIILDVSLIIFTSGFERVCSSSSSVASGRYPGSISQGP